MHPDFDLLTVEFWGSGYESVGPWPLGSGIVLGSNPPYGIADFLAMYPKFGGPILNLIGTLTSGSPVVTVPSVAVLALGQLVTGVGVASGSVIIGVDSVAKTITLSLNVSATGPSTLSVYTAPFAPIQVFNVYIALASASVMQERWCEAWQLGMALFIAHFLTLWMKSEGGTYVNAGQAAAAGLAQGIMVSKSAGPVSVGYQTIQGLESWAAWNLTTYGQSFATLAKCVGMGPILVY